MKPAIGAKGENRTLLYGVCNPDPRHKDFRTMEGTVRIELTSSKLTVSCFSVKLNTHNGRDSENRTHIFAVSEQNSYR